MIEWLRSTCSQLLRPSSSRRDFRSSTDGAREEVLLDGSDGKGSSVSGSPLIKLWRSTSHRGRISREFRNSTDAGRRLRCWLGEPGEAVGEGCSTGTARERPGEVGGRRKWRGTAVGDSVVDLATECRRCLGNGDSWGRPVPGEAGRLRDFGVKSSVLSVAGGEVDWLRGLCCGISFRSDPAATTAALTAGAGSHEAP